MEFCHNNIIHNIKSLRSFVGTYYLYVSVDSPQKITHFAQVARMFTLNGFLCTGETDFFPETKKKNVEILYELNSFVSTITKLKEKKHSRLTFPRCSVLFPMSPKYEKFIIA